MVKATLVDELIKDAAALVEELDRRDFPVDSMFWVHLEDQDYWRLVIASPIVPANGPAKAYRELQKVVRGLDLSGLDLMDISLLEPDSQQLSVFRSIAENSSVLAVGPTFSRLEDAIVYRWEGCAMTAELDCDVTLDRVMQAWEKERKRSNLPRLLFNLAGRRLTIRFHPQHGPQKRIESIKQSFQLALDYRQAGLNCKVNWLN